MHPPPGLDTTPEPPRVGDPAGHATLAVGRRTADSPVCRYCNNVRLPSAVGYVTPMHMLAGRQKEIQAARDRKLEEACQKRQLRRRTAAWSNLARRAYNDFAGRNRSGLS